MVDDQVLVVTEDMPDRMSRSSEESPKTGLRKAAKLFEKGFEHGDNGELVAPVQPWNEGGGRVESNISTIFLLVCV
jgi:hypothetical protein